MMDLSKNLYLEPLLFIIMGSCLILFNKVLAKFMYKYFQKRNYINIVSWPFRVASIFAGICGILVGLGLFGKVMNKY